VDDIGISDRRFVFLVNPRARRQRAERCLYELIEKRKSIGSVSRCVAIQSAADVRAALSALAEDEIPVAAGGDGTASTVARELLALPGRHPPLGILPLGTGNALAHCLGLHSPQEALQSLSGNRVWDVDVMETSHAQAPLALLSISTGFEADFLQSLQQGRGRSLALGALSAARRVAARRRSGASLTLDGIGWVDREERFYSLGLYNMTHFAFGRRVFNEANMRDGLAEAAIAPTLGAYWRGLWHGIPLSSESTPAWTRSRQWRVALIDTPFALQFDGEPVAPGRFEIRVVPKALRLITGPPASK
jgi:diacylglycerol kinase family enzyme